METHLTDKEVSDNHIKQLVGKNYQYYERKWDPANKKTMTSQWNWAACFLTIPWLLYRKMYLCAFLLHLSFTAIFLAPLFFDLPSSLRTALELGSCGIIVFFGFRGNDLYKDYIVHRLKDLQETLSPEELEEKLASYKGTSAAFVILYVLLSLAQAAYVLPSAINRAMQDLEKINKQSHSQR